MQAIISYVFRVIQFPHQGKIVTIEQLDYYASPNLPHKNIPLFGDSMGNFDSFGVGIFKESSVMGTFPMFFPI